MIKVGIVGFGNLGKSVFNLLKQDADFKLIAVFSRREKDDEIDIKLEKMENLKHYKHKIDVLFMCGGSKNDLEVLSPQCLQDFCIIDSFDNHKKILGHFKKLDKIGKQNNTLAMLSVGWDPGLFSMMRLLFSSILGDGKTYTFWGKGISQGHSDAIRQIDEVVDARQYTIPNKKALKSVEEGKDITLSKQNLHVRECFVTIKNSKDKRQVENKIKKMPDYFLGYKTKVHFLRLKALHKKHNKLFHGGAVFRNGKIYDKNIQLKFSLKLDSNPYFTASVLICFARGLHKMFKEGKRGAITVFDMPLKYLCDRNVKEQIKEFL